MITMITRDRCLRVRPLPKIRKVIQRTNIVFKWPTTLGEVRNAIKIPNECEIGEHRRNRRAGGKPEGLPIGESIIRSMLDAKYDYGKDVDDVWAKNLLAA
jgi:hypothetical protein